MTVGVSELTETVEQINKAPVHWTQTEAGRKRMAQIASQKRQKPNKSIVTKQDRIIAWLHDHPKTTTPALMQRFSASTWTVKEARSRLNNPIGTVRKATKSDRVRAYRRDHPTESTARVAKVIKVSPALVNMIDRADHTSPPGQRASPVRKLTPHPIRGKYTDRYAQGVTIKSRVTPKEKANHDNNHQTAPVQGAPDNHDSARERQLTQIGYVAGWCRGIIAAHARRSGIPEALLAAGVGEILGAETW